MQRPEIVMLCVVALAGCSGHDSPNPTGPGGNNPVPTLSYEGTFHPVAHAGAGMAEGYVIGATTELRFTDSFATQGGPNLEVWLVEASDLTDNQGVLQSPHVSLGPLQSASGAQSYPVPANIDLALYRSVTVWCVSAQVNFTTAPLMMP